MILWVGQACVCVGVCVGASTYVSGDAHTSGPTNACDTHVSGTAEGHNDACTSGAANIPNDAHTSGAANTHEAALLAGIGPCTRRHQPATHMAQWQLGHSPVVGHRLGTPGLIRKEKAATAVHFFLQINTITSISQ